MSYRIPGGHPGQKPTRSPQIDWKHPLASQLVGAWLVPDRLVTTGDGVDAWHYRIPNGVDDNYARIEGTNSFGPGPRGTVLNFFSGVSPGSAAYIARKDTQLDYSSQMSLFVRARIPANGFKWLVSKVGGSWLGVSNLNKLVWTIAAGNDKLSNTTIGDGLWHTVGMTLAGTTLSLYVDGLLDATYTGVTNSVTATDTFWGHRGDWVEFFDGSIEWVYQWKRPITASEVFDLQENPFGIYSTDNLSRYYVSAVRNLSATGDRVTQLALEAAYPSPTNPANNARVTREAVEVAYLGTGNNNLTTYNSPASGAFALIYSVSQPTGPIWSTTYQTQMGLSGAQQLTWDMTSTVVNAVLVTDADGLPPTGNTTYDQTPTVTFIATGAAGTGPFLYTWSLTTGGNTSGVSGTTILSGSIIADTRITLPALLPASGYILYVTAVSAAGTRTTITPLLFTVLARRPPPARPFVELPAFDLEPVAPGAADYLRYLPRWMSVHGTATAAPSAALLFQTFTPVLQAMHTAAEAGLDVAGQVALSLVPLNLPRLAWRLQTRLTAADAPTLSVRCSGDIREIRRAGSEYDFFTADDPVYLLGNSGQMLFRNLALREVATTAVATGGALLAQYQMPAEGEGIVPDTNVLFTENGAWLRIRGGSSAIDPPHAVVQLSPTLTGSHTFRYQSESYLPLVQVAVSGQPWTSPGTLDLWNRFDEIALLSGLERRPGEDNVSFRRRLASRLLVPPGNRREDVQLAIAADLALTEVLGWDGLSTLDLAASGFTGVRAVLVPDLPAIGSWQGELFPDGDQRYWAEKRGWLPGWQVTVDGRPATRLSYPGLTQSGFTADFGQSVSGRVEAQLQFAHYTTTLTDGFVTGILPCSGNVASGAYQVLLAQNVRLFVPADPGYQAEALLNADGTPNQFFLELKERLLAHSPLHVTRARWGSATWLEDDDALPQLSHLPVPLDRFADSSGLAR